MASAGAWLGPAEPGVVGTWFGPGLPDPVKGRSNHGNPNHRRHDDPGAKGLASAYERVWHGTGLVASGGGTRFSAHTTAVLFASYTESAATFQSRSLPALICPLSPVAVLTRQGGKKRC